MAKKQRDEGGGYSWMDTYGDMVTLLLCFFVLLYSMSTVNEDKWEMLVRAFSSRNDQSQQLILDSEQVEGNDMAENSGATDADEEVNIETLPESFDELYKYIKSYIEQNKMEGTVSVEKGGDNSVYIRFQDNIFFQPDSAYLMSESTGILEFIGRCIKSVEHQVLMTRVNGHTADPGIDNYRISDRTLSTDRANSVVIYFEEIIGIDRKKLISSGYGKNFPVADNTTAEGRQRNRRVEMMIISNEALASTDELNGIMQDILSTDIFKDQLNTESMIVPPATAEPGTAEPATEPTTAEPGVVQEPAATQP